MQCTKCGKQLDENSKFCQYCGEPVIIVTEQPPEPSETSEPEGWFEKIKKQYDISNKQVGVYLIWVFIHLLFWLFNGDYDSGDRFWPFAKDDLRYYDFTEFFVYTVTPIVFFVVRKLFKSK